MDKFPLATAAWPHLLGHGAVAGVATAVAHPAVYLPLWLLVIFIAFFFRDPARATQAPPMSVISPADGKVVVIEEVEHPWLTGKCRLVSIFMNVFNVHVNRAPVAGEVLKTQHRPGSFHRADLDQARLANEQQATLVALADGRQLVFSQVAGLVARKIECNLTPGMRLSRGQRIGLIRFGSRVDLYLPLDTTLTVSLGDNVRAGVSRIGDL